MKAVHKGRLPCGEPFFLSASVVYFLVLQGSVYGDLSEKEIKT